MRRGHGPVPPDVLLPLLFAVRLSEHRSREHHSNQDDDDVHISTLRQRSGYVRAVRAPGRNKRGKRADRQRGSKEPEFLGLP